jgi:transposase
VLWEEYRAADPGGYGYSRFCDLFREFEQRLSPSMRQTHVAGDKVFVDYSGKKLGIVDPATGEIREAEIFVAVLGASGCTYPEILAFLPHGANNVREELSTYVRLITDVEN